MHRYMNMCVHMDAHTHTHTCIHTFCKHIQILHTCICNNKQFSPLLQDIYKNTCIIICTIAPTHTQSCAHTHTGHHTYIMANTCKQTHVIFIDTCIYIHYVTYTVMHTVHITLVSSCTFLNIIFQTNNLHIITVCYLWLISISLADTESIFSSLVRKASISDSSKLKCLFRKQMQTHNQHILFKYIEIELFVLQV